MTYSIVSIGSQSCCVSSYQSMFIVVRRCIVHILPQHHLRRTASETNVTCALEIVLHSQQPYQIQHLFVTC